MTLGVNAGDMKKIGLANPNTPSLVKTDTKEELVKLIESCLDSIVSNTVQTEQHY
jgi:hypothetical protein